ncbi:MAG: hypothetical protein EBY20_02300 [Alphaproteobacteria bacterium]|nr:hypothetical protein [Alphaproteobacteria bacterium]
MSVSSPWSPFPFKNVPDPLGNIDPKYVNVTNSNDPRGFGSNETNRQWGLSGVSNNAQAAAASALKGGSKSKTLRRKIKNIANKYKKMKGGKSRKTTLGSIKRRLAKIIKLGKSKRHHKKTKKTVSRRHRGTKRQRGGYSQYMSNVPYTPSYSTGGQLSANLSALANPVPYQPTNNCVDNYNYNTNKGFQM